MATESAVTPAGCHPFSVGPDQCLVHNGSFANHATIRRELAAAGVLFDSENDSEVGARFVAARLAQGEDLEKALRPLCERFDGFYTLLVTSADGFAVVRDAIACKPADHRRDGPLGGDGLGVPRPGRAAGHRRGADLRAGAGAGLRMAALTEMGPTEMGPTGTGPTATDVTATRTSTSRTISVRALNAELHAPAAAAYEVLHPQGAHAIAAGLRHRIAVDVHGHAGYYCAGMNDGRDGHRARQRRRRRRGEHDVRLVRVRGDASQSAGATGHGGLLVVEGSASMRCGISMKGVDIVVGGDIGPMSAFMAQAGRLVVCGDAGDALGDSIYEARVYVRGAVGLARRGLRREADARRAPRRARRAARHRRARPRRRRSSAATARPGGSTTSRPATPRPY